MARRSRRLVAIAVLGLAHVMTLVACTRYAGEEAAPPAAFDAAASEGGQDVIAADAASDTTIDSSAVLDATPDAKPGIACGATKCTSVEACCMTGATSTCTSAETCSGFHFACFGKKDCETGLRCCLEPEGRSSCAATCSYRDVCDTFADCNGGPCTQATCTPGIVFATCGPGGGFIDPPGPGSCQLN